MNKGELRNKLSKVGTMEMSADIFLYLTFTRLRLQGKLKNHPVKLNKQYYDYLRKAGVINRLLR